jgi:hypothetical protein
MKIQQQTQTKKEIEISKVYQITKEGNFEFVGFTDPNGDRIKTYNNITNTTTYTPFKEYMLIVNSSGEFNYTYIYQDDVLVARINPDGSKWFYHADHLGSTTLITDKNGSVVEEEIEK